MHPPAARAERYGPYVFPFLTLIIVLAAAPYLPFNAEFIYPLRTVLVTVVLLFVSLDVIRLRPTFPVSSVLVGLAVLAIWVGVDLVFPGYRNHWIFHNPVTGAGVSTLPEQVRHNPLFLFFRVAGSTIVVPIAEELFWRAWLMRRLISPEIEKVPLGAYSALSFWGTALLFASEHGAYWDVGLAAGVIYNLWMIRTRSIADCILAHAVTNGCLAAYVLATGRWEYWL